LHRQKAYEALGYKAGDFPVTEKVASEIVSLPMFPNLTPEQQGRVVHEVANFLQVAVAAGK
jgi:dTDP-4-amino-4,6-dideoxygalactose transaminase